MQAFVGLGSNLGQRRRNLRAGIAGLSGGGIELARLSSVWESEPVGSSDPRWFLNMVARVESDLGPEDLLRRLLAVEAAAGRTRAARNAPRTLDLDLLLYGACLIDRPGLTLPHPRMWDRRFVLEPLFEIAPDLRNPRNGNTVGQELGALRDDAVVVRLERLAPPEALPL